MTDRPNDHREPRALDATLACERFAELLPDLLEGTLPAPARAEAERHRAGCAACAALAADLEAIARDAAALPPLRPERDLWAGIAERIEPTVVPLDARRGQRVAAPRPTYTVTRRWMGAAAAALVLVTSSLTYVVARRGDGAAPAAGRTDVAAASPTPSPAAPDASADAPAAPRPFAEPSSEAPPASAGAAGSPAGGGARSGAPRRPAAPAAARLPDGDARLASSPAVSAAAAYDREIAALRDIVRERRAELDTGTVRVLEQSLRVIDQAIAQSRAALARDPGSQFLGEQLTRALDSKVQLLRTVALLRPRGA